MMTLLNSARDWNIRNSIVPFQSDVGYSEEERKKEEVEEEEEDEAGSLGKARRRMKRSLYWKEVDGSSHWIP